MDVAPLRLAERILDPTMYERVDEVFLVEETAEDGEARLSCRIPSGALALRFRTSRQEFPSRFRFLRSSRSCDGAVLLLRPDGRWEAHVVECKRTMAWDKWDKAKEQLGWSLVRLHTLAHVLGISIAASRCHSVFREDRLDRSPATADPALARHPLGRPRLDWLDDQVHLPAFERPVTHTRHRLDVSDGTGACTL